MTTSKNKARQAFTSFLKRVDKIRDEFSRENHEPIWYRGQSSRSHGVLPSLFRKNVLKTLSVKNLGNKAGREKVVRLENDLFFDFQARMGENRTSIPSAWDLLFLMRHYGIPTRVLDWSENFGVAVYFATQGATRGARIWLLHPYAMNEMSTSWGRRDTILAKYLSAPRFNQTEHDYDDILGYGKINTLEYELPVAICPSYSNHRMQSQSGTFTVHGTLWKPMNSMLGKNVLQYVDMDKTMLQGARLFLRDAGLSERVLFPGLDGLSREMLEKYKAQ